MENNEETGGHEVERSSTPPPKRLRQKSSSSSSDSEEEQTPEDNLQTVSKAAQKALTIDLILEIILNNLPTRHVVRCRLVSPEWNKAAKIILKNRPDANVKVDGKTNFDSLSSCIEDSTDFPFHGIHLECGDQDFKESPEQWLQLDFLRRHSKKFTRLELTVKYVRGLELVDGLFASAFNHIVSLRLGRIHLDVEMEHDQEGTDLLRDEDGNLVNLVKLKTISIPMDCDWWYKSVNLTFLTRLLQACPNLECIKGFRSEHVPALFTAGKLGAVKTFHVWDLANIYGYYDEGYPMLSTVEALTIGDWGSEINFSCLKPLLEWSRQSLRSIEVQFPVKGSWNINDWPQLSNLKFLKLTMPFDFPNSVEGVFPALQTVQLGPCSDSRKYSVQYIWEEPLTSVTKLEIFEPIDPGNWKRLSAAVPNVRHIFLDADCCEIQDDWDWNVLQHPEIVDFWAGLCCFQRLETLCISPVDLQSTNLDEFFNRIFGYTLNNLEDSLQRPLSPVPLPSEPVSVERKSIASHPALKELIIRFTMSDDVTRDDFIRWNGDHLPYLADLKDELNTVPVGIKIIFMYDHFCKNAELMKEILSPFGERVTTAHWNANLATWMW